MDLLENRVHHDAWGSTTAIPALRGTPPDGRPHSELWVGAHPSSPSVVTREGLRRGLDDVIAADPEGELGVAIAAAYGARLPFLLKVLAAERSLSLQAHPSLEQARAGFTREESQGVPRTSPTRRYPDASHKPELLCALTPFEALCGLRETDETRELLDELAVPGLQPLDGLLRRDPGPGGARAALEWLLDLGEDSRRALVQDVVTASAPASPPSRWDRELAAARVLDSEHPGDVGVLASLLLNHVVLEPGEAVFLAAGNLHAYLRGTGVEVMASSDNVLRLGLTSRLVDQQELLRILDDGVGPAPTIEPRRIGEHVERYTVPVPDFQLDHIALEQGETAALDVGPRVVLAVAGSVVLTTETDELGLSAGESAWLPARDGLVVVSGAVGGTASAYVASCATPGAASTGGAAG